MLRFYGSLFIDHVFHFAFTVIFSKFYLNLPRFFEGTLIFFENETVLQLYRKIDKNCYKKLL